MDADTDSPFSQKIYPSIRHLLTRMIELDGIDGTEKHIQAAFKAYENIKTPDALGFLQPKRLKLAIQSIFEQLKTTEGANPTPPGPSPQTLPAINTLLPSALLTAVTMVTAAAFAWYHSQ
jgi:hypothetical protein